jgi:hypothetical protein
MARRNPMNERYQKNTAPAGKTRRSAASAKPSRSSGEAAKPADKKTGSRPRPVYHPPTPEYRKLRYIWWGLIGMSVALSSAAWFIWRDPSARNLGMGVLVVGYGFIAAAIWLDWSKLRPLRQAWMKQHKDKS